MQNCTFSIGQYRKKRTCLDFIFTQFAVIYTLIKLVHTNYFEASELKFVLDTLVNVRNNLLIKLRRRFDQTTLAFFRLFCFFFKSSLSDGFVTVHNSARATPATHNERTTAAHDYMRDLLASGMSIPRCCISANTGKPEVGRFFYNLAEFICFRILLRQSENFSDSCKVLSQFAFHNMIVPVT